MGAQQGHIVSLSEKKSLKYPGTTGMLISIHFGAEVFIKYAVGQLTFNRDTMCPFAVKGT